MNRSWVDLVARVRGLSTRFITRAGLAELARSRDLVRLGAALEDVYGPSSGIAATASAEELELAVRRAAANQWRIAARWSDERTAALMPFLLDEDRRSVRALLRGAAARSLPRERLAGLVPTPLLPEAALEELARQQSLASVAALLAAWGHPFGAALLASSRPAKPDLFRLDVQLNREYAARARAAILDAPAMDSIRNELHAFVRSVIDAENASTALQLASDASSIDPADLFLPGGGELDSTQFVAAAKAGSTSAARSVLARAFRHGAFAVVFRAATTRSFEDDALRAQQQRALAQSRRAPLGASPLIAFALRLRAQVRDLRFIIWRIAAGAPAANASALVSVQ